MSTDIRNLTMFSAAIKCARNWLPLFVCHDFILRKVVERESKYSAYPASEKQTPTQCETDI